MAMEHFVVLEIMEQRERSTRGIAGHENSGAGNAVDFLRREVAQEQVQRHGHLFDAFAQNLPAPPPGEHEVKNNSGHQQREPAAVGDLEHVRAEEGEIDGDEETGDRDGDGKRPVPAATRDPVEENGRDQHRGSDGDAVSGSEVSG